MESEKVLEGLPQIHTVLVSQQAVFRIVEELKKQIALPFELEVVFKECGTLILTTTKPHTKLSFVTNLLTFTPNYSRDN
jgi:hypothetical protein